MLTFNCNWFCNFCATDTHSKPKLTFDEVKNKLNQVEEYSQVSISGGEPGMILPRHMKYIIEELQKKHCKININTNGLFFKKYEKYADNVDSYFYHCSEKLDNVVIPPMSIFKNVEYMIVVTDETYVNLDSFIENNKEIKFSIFGADKYTVNGKPGASLSKMNALRIYTKYKNILPQESISYLLERCTIVNDKLKVL